MASCAPSMILASNLGSSLYQSSQQHEARSADSSTERDPARGSGARAEATSKEKCTIKTAGIWDETRAASQADSKEGWVDGERKEKSSSRSNKDASQL